MKSFLILIILCIVSIAKAGVLKRYLETENSENKNDTPFKLSQLSKYPETFDLSNRESRSASENSRIYGQRKHYPPHRYRYYKSLNPSHTRRFRDESNVLFPKRRRNMPDKRLDSYNADAKILSFNRQVFTVKSHTSRRDKNNNYAGIPQKDTHVAKATNNGRISDKINVAGSNRYSDKTFPVKEDKIDLTKEKRPKEKVQKILKKISPLYLLGLLLTLIPLVSIILALVVPISTFCWRKFKKPNRKEDAEQNDPKTTMVKTVIVNKSQAKVKQAKESDSYQNVVRNFVSNAIDGEGDSVAKDMKLERWMMQGLPPQGNPRSKRNNNYMADMESVAEEPSDIESTSEHTTQPPISPVGSEDEELMPLLGRNKNRRGDASKANRQESHPFHFPDVGVTIGRVINPRYPRHTDRRHTNPRNLFSLINQPGRFGKPKTQSMVEIIPEK